MIFEKGDKYVRETWKNRFLGIQFQWYFQVDIIDFNGSFLTRIRDIVGANPIVLVATKVGYTACNIKNLCFHIALAVTAMKFSDFGFSD